MIRVGLTGTVAGGKSTVGRFFESWGAARIDADALAREAVAPGSPALARIRDRWGDQVLAPDGTLDRKALRLATFGDDGDRTELERIVHAEVRRLRDEWRDRLDPATEVVVEEIPLLFETGLDAGYDAIVVVDAPVSVRRQRATAQRGWTAAEFDQVEAAQMDPSEKRERADHVVWNAGDPDALENAAREVWDALLSARGEAATDGRAGRDRRGPSGPGRD